MGIKRIQLRRIVDRIVKHYLFNGRYPTFQTITHHLSHWLQGNNPGAPSFKPRLVRKREKSDSKKHNENIEEIYTDINDAYEATINQTQRIMKDFNYIETERDKVSHSLAEISNQIDNLLMLESNADFRHFKGRSITFEDAAMVDQKESTIDTDLKEREVTLKENLSKTKRLIVNSDRVQFRTLAPNAKSEALQTIENAFDDNLNTSWWQVVKTKTPGSTKEENSYGMKAELLIMFEKVEEFNQIDFVPHHGKSTYVRMEFTLDGTSFIAIPNKNNYREVIGPETWKFEKIKARGIRIVFEKREHDDNSAGVYQYYFGAKNIAITNKSYLSEGTFYSYPISFGETIRSLTMFSDDIIPQGTSIDYEVAAFDKNLGKSQLTWFPISSYDDPTPKASKVIEFSTKHLRTIESNNSIATGEIINGMNVFKLVKDNGDSIVSEIKEEEQKTESFDAIKEAMLFRGINQWKRERTFVPFRGTIPINGIWTQEYEKRVDKVAIDYIPIGNTLYMKGGRGGHPSDNLYRFTTCIYADYNVSYPLSLSVVQTLSSGARKRLGAYSVYLNGKRLSSKNDEVTLEFKKGWNEIQVLYHWGDMEERKDILSDQIPSEAYLGKFNFFRQEKVRADLKPLTYVETHSLFHNVSPNNRNFFTLHERQVVLNYRPDNCIFQLRYEANIEDQLTGSKILVRANLKREENIRDITPSIKRISIRAK